MKEETLNPSISCQEFRCVGAMALALLLSLAPAAHAQDRVIPIWPGVAPGSENWTQKEAEYRTPQGQRWVRNVVKPSITVFLPSKAKATGTAIIVCPGGGFRFLSWESEGTEVARWLVDHGVAALVLKYRLVDTGATDAQFQNALQALFSSISRPRDEKGASTADLGAANVPELAAEDGRQAIRVVRRHAAEWGIAPDRIGILGFSAGAMVTDEVALRHDTGSRPNFAVRIYGPVFGEVPVPADAPPLFILCADNDPLAASSSARLYLAWKAAGKPAELHIYAKGGHGFGMNKQGLPVDHWIDGFGDWLQAQGLMKQ
jgi:acetyl esterase/lipase